MLQEIWFKGLRAALRSIGFDPAPIIGPGQQRARKLHEDRLAAEAARTAHLPSPADTEASRQVSRRYARKLAKMQQSVIRSEAIRTRRTRRAA